MRLSDYLIAIIVFGIIVTGFVTIGASTFGKYGGSISNNTGAYDKTEDISVIAYDSTDELKSTSIENEDSESGVIKAGFGALKNVLTSFSTVKDIWLGVSNLIKIPAFIYLAVSSIILVAITFALYGVLFRKNI